MDRDVLPRVTYWTGTWDPQREAISKEIEALRQLHASPAPVVAFSSGNRTGVDLQKRVIKLSGNRWIAFRACAAIGELVGAVTHAFGRVDAWPIFRSLGRRPFIFTAVADGPPLNPAMYRRARVFVAESEPLAAALVDAGVQRQDIRIIYPGVDLAHFAPTPLPAGTFRILFASSPSEPSEIGPRGLGLLVELARRHADVEFVVLWRNWGDVRNGLDALKALAPPDNFRVEELGSRQMRDVYGAVHATICLFDTRVGKSCPNSIVEGLACGRPALIADTCDIARLVSSANAGIAGARTIDAISEGLITLRAGCAELGKNARALAETHFDVNDFCRKYKAMYHELARAAR